MIKKPKPAPKGAARVQKAPVATSAPKRGAGLTLKFEIPDEALVEILAEQRRWAEDVAAGIERGALPDAKSERRMIASIIRAAAGQLVVPPKAKRRGNPSFLRKLPSDDTVPLMVAMRMKAGLEEQDAIASVAETFDVDDSTVARMFRPRRAAMLAEVANDIVIRRGAIPPSLRLGKRR